jgi:ATP-binding protein involved in chromosome partitioning
MVILQPRRLAKISKILMVSSGKGGVGKSTIAANIAVGLSRRGYQVGLLDLDIFGPSIPRLMGLSNNDGVDEEGKMLKPLSNYGVKCMSMGFLVPTDGPIAWRGLMVMKGVQQLLWQVDWGPLDYLILDMPPGTGDTHITVSQQLVIDHALIVTTPQLIALSATEKGLLFLTKMRISILGIVENMKYVQCNKCANHVKLFTDYTGELSGRHNIPILASLPMSPQEADASDAGQPVTSMDRIPTHYSTLLDKIPASVKSF